MRQMRPHCVASKLSVQQPSRCGVLLAALQCLQHLLACAATDLQVRTCGSSLSAVAGEAAKPSRRLSMFGFNKESSAGSGNAAGSGGGIGWRGSGLFKSQSSLAKATSPQGPS